MDVGPRLLHLLCLVLAVLVIMSARAMRQRRPLLEACTRRIGLVKCCCVMKVQPAKPGLTDLLVSQEAHCLRQVMVLGLA